MANLSCNLRRYFRYKVKEGVIRKEEVGNAIITMLSYSDYCCVICREWFCCFPWEDSRVRRRIRRQGYI
jgi:hypothetical protein